MLALDMHRAAAGRGAAVEGRGEGGDWGTACNVNGNCVAVAGQHRTDSQSVIQLVSQAALLPTYTHTHTHALARTECHSVYVCVCVL